MGCRCFVPNCNSGSRSCTEKVVTFKAPSDPERLQAWSNAIGRKQRELRSTDYVCVKHFTDDMIGRRRYYGELGGVVLLDAPMKPVLLPEAIPCIFPEVSSHVSVGKKRRARRGTAARNKSAKRRKVGRGSVSGTADSNSSPQTSTEFGNNTRDPSRPVKTYLPRRSRIRAPLYSSVVTNEHFGGEGSDLVGPGEVSFPTQSTAQTVVCSNVVGSAPHTEPGGEESVPATPVEAAFPVCSGVVKSEPSALTSEECESILPNDSNLCLESSCQTSVCSNVVKIEPFTEPSSEGCVPATVVAPISTLELSHQDPVHSVVIKSEPSAESGSEECVSVTPVQADISLESSEVPACSSVVTNGYPAGPNEEEPAATLPAAQQTLSQETEQTCSIAKELQVVLPSSAWRHQDVSVDGVESHCFVQLLKTSPTSPVLVFKCLELETTVDGLKITRRVLGRVAGSVVIQVVPETRYAPYVSDELRSFDKETVCRGGPTRDEYPEIQLQCASVDPIGFWRHNNCTLCIDCTETQCMHCRSLINRLRAHMVRRKKQEKEKHARSFLNRSRLSKLQALRRKQEAWQQDKRSLEDRIRALNSELRASRRKVQALSSAEILDVVKTADIPETYRVLLSECLAATNVASERGMRYSDKWVELCALLHKRTPAGYQVLREMNMLPLPSMRILSKCVSEGSTDDTEEKNTSADL